MPTPRSVYFDEAGPATLRDLATPLLRYRHVSALVAVAGVVTTLILATMAAPTWDATMKILVTRERTPEVGGAVSDRASTIQSSVSESDLYSAMLLLESREVLEEVITRAALLPPALSANDGAAHQARLARAVDALDRAINVTPVHKTAVLEVTYRAHDPAQAARVLEVLAQVCTARLLAQPASPGPRQFFTEQTERARAELRAALANLAERGAREGIVAVDRERHPFETLSDLEATLQQAESSIAELTRRISVLDEALVMTPAPLNDAASGPSLASHQWLVNEKVRARTERDAQVARADSARRRVADYRARGVQEQRVEHKLMLLDVQAAEQTFLLYQRKQEEARISDAIDRTRIGLAVMQPPVVPHSPRSRRSLILASGSVLTLLLGAAVAHLLHAFNPYFRTPDEVHRVLGVPVLASLPADAD